jgi:hypothetical protein
MIKRGDHIMGLLTWLFGGHSKPTASTAVTAQSTTVDAPKKTTKKMTATKSTKKTTKKTTKKPTAKKGRGRPKKK